MRIEPLGPAHDRANFRCSLKSLDKYFHAQALRDAAKGLAAVFVLADAEGQVAGYYTLSAATVLLPDLLGAGARKQSRYPALAAARLTRLAVDKRHRRRGHGAHLLADARDRLCGTSGITALIAEAPFEAAQRFYEHAGFTPFQEQPGRLFMPLLAETKTAA